MLKNHVSLFSEVGDATIACIWLLPLDVLCIEGLFANV